MGEQTTDIGFRLRLAREQRGLTLRDISNTTKISMTALGAIEQNDFARLPGGVFRRAYVRAFASEVGLNPDELARDFRSHFEIERAAEPIPPDGDRAGRSHRLHRLAAALVIAAGILTCALLVFKRAQSSHDSRDEAPALIAVEAGPQTGAVQTD